MQTRNIEFTVKDIKDDKNMVTRMGLFNIQVCSELTKDEALEWVREMSPSETYNNWQKGDSKPVQCLKMKNRKHYVYVC